MKYLLIIICVLTGFTAAAQKDTPLQKIEINLPDTDFIKKQMEKVDSINRENSMRSMNNNMSSFFADMRERERKQKQQLWIRFGFFGLTLALVIIGFIRRRNKKKEEGSV